MVAVFILFTTLYTALYYLQFTQRAGITAANLFYLLSLLNRRIFLNFLFHSFAYNSGPGEHIGFAAEVAFPRCVLLALSSLMSSSQSSVSTGHQKPGGEKKDDQATTVLSILMWYLCDRRRPYM